MSAVFLAILSNAGFISLKPVSLALIKRAAELNIKLIDAIHVATAEAL
ncbi:hypothetical protein [Neorhizobium galegae]|nr:hypothetical protein [Neorhizobium galegae]UIK05549.1 hypothetical protein LZK81_00625 [Neorhizobium galegae]CDZ66758.1 Hypothetical protein NGAL_HAMBI2605_50360 [Neorhizobium galegae bv. orientalis]CDZ73741.1 Hypothetical protein NGAL_HAMBI2610_53730 [Neorhizobium galegae bv. orientalis]